MPVRLAFRVSRSSKPIPESARAFLGLGLNPLVQAASPLLLRMGQMRNAPPSLDVSSLRRSALDEIRRFEERARASGVRMKSCWRRGTCCAPGSTRPCCRRRRRAERVGAASAAGGAAPRGLGRRKVLRDARSDLGGSRAAHRFDGAAVPGPRARLHRQVSDARSRPRAAGRSAAQPESHHPRISAEPRPPISRCSGGGSKINGIGSFATCRGGWSVAAALAILGVTFAIYYSKLASQAAAAARAAGAGRDRRLRRASASGAAGAGPDAQAAARAGRGGAAR